MKCTAIIAAGGTGKRFGGDIPKQFTELAGLPVIIHTLRIFESITEVNSIVISVHSDWLKATEGLVSSFNITKVDEIVLGGHTRQESVANALRTDSISEAEIVLVHDAVRPCASVELVNKIIDTAGEFGAAIPAIIPEDTIKEKNAFGAIVRTLDRTKLCHVQTPQGFWQELIVSAYENAAKSGYNGTDCSTLVEFLGYKVQTVEGEEKNIKIATPFDIKIAELVVKDNYQV